MGREKAAEVMVLEAEAVKGGRSWSRNGRNGGGRGRKSLFLQAAFWPCPL